MLDLFFRKYAWTANLVLLFAAAWLSAKTVNTLVGAVDPPDAAVPTSRAASGAAAARRCPPPLDDRRSSTSSSAQEPPRDGGRPRGGADAPQNCDDPRAAPSKSDLRLQLVAGVSPSGRASSLATIVDLEHARDARRRRRRRGRRAPSCSGSSA